jgi:hypothetical protein
MKVYFLHNTECKSLFLEKLTEILFEILNN